MSEIFLSYAHRDDLLPEDWVKETKKFLQLRLNQLYGRDASKIIIDKEWKGNEVLPEKIKSSLINAKVLLSIVSPSYFESEWCRREVEIFHELNGGEAYKRIVRVDKMAPNEEHEQISALNLQIYKKFYNEDGEYFIDHQQGVYRTEIYKLAKDLKNLLDDINKSLHKEETQDKVFFPDCPEDKAIYLDMVKSGVFGNKYNLTQTPFYHGDIPVGDWLKNTQRDIVNSKCIVHVLGEDYGLIPEDATYNPGNLSVYELQYNVIKKERGANRFFHIVWKPRGLVTPDKRQAAFIKKLEEEHSSDYSFAEFVEKDIVDFQNYLKAKVQQFASLEKILVTTQTTNKKPVYFLFPYSHEDMANQFKEKLAASNLNIDLKIVPKNLGDSEKHVLHSAYCETIGCYLVMPVDNTNFRSSMLSDLIPKTQAFHRPHTIDLDSYQFEGFEFYLLSKQDDETIQKCKDFFKAL